MHAQLFERLLRCVWVRFTFQLNNWIFPETMGTMHRSVNINLNTIFENLSRLEHVIIEFDDAECAEW